MLTEIRIPTFTERERHWQIRALLAENGVPKPMILWIQGKALRQLISSMGKDPFFKDGKIYDHEQYRFNLDTGRFRKAEPRPQEG